MPDRFDPPEFAASEATIEAGLGNLAGAIAWPAPSTDFAVRVRDRVTVMPAPVESPWARWRSWLGAPVGRRPIRRSLLIAVALLLIAATVVVAMGFALPGLRIIFGPGPSPLPSRSVDPSATMGSSLGLGVAVDLDDAGRHTGFTPRWPTEASIGLPDVVFVAGTRLTLVWAASSTLPEIEGAPGVGLLVTEFRGEVDEGYYEKLVHQTAEVEHVSVGGRPGYWIFGRPHVLVYREPGGAYVEETRRMVGDALVWRDGELTLRVETSLGRDEAIRIAESIR